MLLRYKTAYRPRYNTYKDLDLRLLKIPGGAKKTRNYNGAYTLWRQIPFCIFVEQYVFLLVTFSDLTTPLNAA